MIMFHKNNSNSRGNIMRGIPAVLRHRNNKFHYEFII